jgi:hypothetical protein
MRSSATIVAFLLGFLNTALANSCVWLDPTNNNATVPADGYSPCPSSSGASTCCGNNDACLSNGYCSGSFGLYRGACTDWSAGVCPDTCPDLTFVSQGKTYYLANLYRCNGQGKGEIWWCGDQSSDTNVQPCQSEAGTTFSMTSIGTFVTPFPLVAAVTASSSQSTTTSGITSRTSSTSKPSPASTSAASSPTTSTNSSALGIGLGVGLGLPLFAAIIALAWVIARRKSSSSTAGMSEKQQMLQQPSGWSSAPEHELQGKQVHKQAREIQSSGQLAELQGYVNHESDALRNSSLRII